MEAFAAARTAPAAGRVIAFEGIRRVVAERLTESLQTMAQVMISREAQVTGLVARRRELAPGFEAATGVRLTYTDLLIETVARLLPEHALLNATLADEGIVVAEAVHMGVAVVALEDGLIVPVIRDAGTRPLGEIAAERLRLAELHDLAMSLTIRLSLAIPTIRTESSRRRPPTSPTSTSTPATR